MSPHAAEAHPAGHRGEPVAGAAPPPAALPPSAFLSRAFQDAEDAAIWTRAWSGVGFAADIPDAGDVLPFTLGNHGIHVERRPDGSMVGRFNKAQHGGCRAVPLQCQTGAKTRCSFTSCGYSRDRGPVAAADPDRDRVLDQYLGLRPERLLPVAVATWGPLVVACLDPQRPSRGWPAWPAHATGAAGAVTLWVEWDANWKHVAAAFVPDRAAIDEADAATATAAGVTMAFPNIVVATAGDAACVAVLQPTALDKTLCRIRTHGSETAWRGLLLEARARAERRQRESQASARADLPDVPRALDPAARWFEGRVARAVAALDDDTAPLYRTDHRGGW